MQMERAVGDRVRVHPSGEVGRITRVVQASDGRPTYEVEFAVARTGERSSRAESGGLYVAEDVEPIE